MSERAKLAAGTTLGHYRIVSELGSGGMGDVYVAEDSSLGRRVALKVLPEEVAGSPDRRERFEREARAVAALSHPNILAIHDFGEEDGIPYAVMELLDGRTLREHLAHGALPRRTAIDYASQITEGLAAAHDKGIVHRDLKPENIFVTKHGRIKILDFGLAKMVETAPPGDAIASAATMERETDPGTVLGSAGYMSPEQVRGHDADRRSDIFSFGAILHEMLSGERAFRGESSIETRNAILKSDPPELTSSSSDVSSGLARVVRRCLEKNPEQRFQSVRDLGFALDVPTEDASPRVPRRMPWIASGVALAIAAVYAVVSRAPEPSLVEKPRLVVLPFENLGPAEDEYFAAGMTEEITSRLAVVKGLAVISRSTAVRYADTDKTAQAIGNELDVDFILEGTVRWQTVGQKRDEGSSRVRVTPQLIRVSDDTHVWAERYDRVVEEIFDVQSDIAENVLAEINVALLGREREAVEEQPTENLEAYQAYMQGIHLTRLADSYLEEVSRRSVEALERAVRLDPSFVQGWIALSDAHLNYYWMGHDTTESRIALAREALDRAASLRPDAGELHLLSGKFYYRARRDYARAFEELEIAREALPNNTDVLELMAYVRRRQGRFEETLRLLESALELSPRNALAIQEYASTLTFLRRYAEAERHYDRAIAEAPDQFVPYQFKAMHRWVWHGDSEETRSLFEQMPEASDSLSVLYRFFQEFYDRRFDAALAELNRSPHTFLEDQVQSWPVALLRAEVHRARREDELATAAWAEAVVLLEERLESLPEDLRLLSAVGMAYAGIGRRDDAVRAGRRAVEKLSMEMDAMNGTIPITNLALIHTMVGDYEAAFDGIGCSGAMYWNVPRMDPCSVRGFCCVGSDDNSFAASRSCSLASPKSTSLAPGGVSMMFPGFKSRCTTPSRCALSSASASSMP